MNTKHLAYCLLLAGVVATTLVGCGGTAASNDNPQLRGAMKVLALQYGTYMASHYGAPPKDEASLREYLQSHLGELQSYNVKSVDELFPKGRDGQPLVVIYGTKLSHAEQPEVTWAAYEQTGDGSTRLASTTRGTLVELSEEDFAKQVPAK